MLGRRGFLATVGALAASASGGCESCKKAGSGKPQVAVSIFPLWDLARRVAGDALDVALVLPGGKTEHAYDPTPKEVQKLAQARLVVRVGLDLDDWAVRIVKGATGGDVPTLELGPKAQPLPMGKEHVGEDEAHEGKGDDDDHHGANDPHFWLDPVRTKATLAALSEAFGKLAPAEQKGFDARRAEVETSLDALHARIDAAQKAWTRRAIVTFHGSFGYFAARYGLTIAAVLEPFPGKEPTSKYLAAVLAAIKESKPAALFSEPQLDKRPATVVAEQAKIPLFELDPVGGVGAVDSYEKLLDANVAVLAKALA